MEQLLGRGPTPTLRREGSASIVFSLPTRERSTCSATDQGTDTSSTSCDDIETEQQVRPALAAQPARWELHAWCGLVTRRSRGSCCDWSVLVKARYV